jgi:hypothetical protein
MQIADVRYPDINGLPADIVHALHHTFVGILLMRQSIESANLAVTSGRVAAIESRALLARLKAEDFYRAAQVHRPA